MAGWSTLSFEFNIFDPLRPPLEAILTALEIIEAILEALLALLKPFLLDLLNPLTAIIQALIAALNALINQIESTGLNLLLVHPDTSQPDIGAIFNSVAGGYPTFENKVVQKFFDASDLFRPQYAPGSSVAMLIFYFGAESPGDLMAFIYALLALIDQGVDVTLPAPIDVKVNPASKSGQIAGQFRSLWGRVPGVDDFNALTVEWRMPQAPQGTDLAGVINQAVSLYNNTRLPNFVVERSGPFPTKGDTRVNPLGEPALMEIDSATLGSKPNAVISRFSFPPVRSKVSVRDIDGSVFRVFPKKFDVAGGNLAEGLLTGSYEFTDDSEDLEPGSTYYYRVRAYFGDASYYILLTSPAAAPAFVKKTNANEPVINFPELQLGKPSRVVAGFMPREVPDAASLNLYMDLLDAVRVGLLLNFELPRTYPDDSGVEDTEIRLAQKAGWGILAGLAGAVGPLKAMFSNSYRLQDNILFNSKARRLVNMSLSSILKSPQIGALIEDKWRGGIQSIVGRFYIRDSGDFFSNDPVLSALNVPKELNLPEDLEDEGGINKIWGLPRIVGGMTRNNAQQIDEYLAQEDSYYVGIPHFFPGPVPLSPDFGEPHVTVQERLDLAAFIQLATGGVGPITSYLVWQALTVGDLFPALVPFLFDFEQFLLALLNAVNSIIKAIQEIIETLLQKIRALKQIIQTILDIIELLSIEISVSVLFTSGFGDPSTLVAELISSEDKPGDSPFGLHSGMVMTAGGPGPGFIAALEAIAYIFSIGSSE